MSLPLRTLGVTALRCARVAPSRTLATTATKRENILTFLPIIPDPFLPGWNGLAWVFMWRYFGKNKGGPKYASIAKMKYVFITVTLPFLFWSRTTFISFLSLEMYLTFSSTIMVVTCRFLLLFNAPVLFKLGIFCNLFLGGSMSVIFAVRLILTVLVTLSLVIISMSFVSFVVDQFALGEQLSP